jgi:hypothetical protein
MSDKHNRKITGYAEHPIVSTLALDTLVAPDTGFTTACTPSPIWGVATICHDPRKFIVGDRQCN